ncbi:MAG: type II toxin-antitoxin system VapC family toxin [Solirubrobacteraceae bacterium]
MTALCDTSLVVKWFFAAEEADVGAARTILDAGIDSRLDLTVLDLTYLELANVCVRSRALSAEQAIELLDRVRLVCGDGIRVPGGLLARIATLAATHGLSFYDAAYWGVAEQRGLDLVTADRALLDAGAGESPSAFVERLALA